MHIYSRLYPPIQYVDMLNIACKIKPKESYNMRYQKDEPNSLGPLTKHDKKAKIRLFPSLMKAQNRS